MPDMKDRKSKKNKKKQVMSEVDLEAGEHIAEPETPTIEKAIYEKPSDSGAAEGKSAEEAPDPIVSKSLGDGTAVDMSTSQTGKSALMGTKKVSIPPPPKSKAKMDAIQVTDEHSSQLNFPNAATVPGIVVTQHDTSDGLRQEEPGKSAADITGSGSPPEFGSEPSKNEAEASSVRYGDLVLEFAVLKTTGAQTTKVRKQQRHAQDAVDIRKVPDSSLDGAKDRTIGKKVANDFLQPDSAAKKAKDPVDTDMSKADTSEDMPKVKLQLMPLVSSISIAPQPPKTQSETVKAVTEQELRLCPLISAWSIEPSMGSVAEQRSQQSAQRKVGNEQQRQKVTNASQRPALPPFDHESFSRSDNIRRQTDKDSGVLIGLETDDGTFAHIHINVLRQIPRFKTFVDQNLSRLMNPPRAHAPRGSIVFPGFEGVSTTYIHWLYNGNLPTSLIDTRHGRTVSAVLLSLAEEYLIGAHARDPKYMNYIMDAFITLQVRTRWLGLESVIECAYEDPAECPMLCGVLADLHAFIFVDKTMKCDFSSLEKMPKEFIVDVLESVVVLKPNEVGEWYWSLKDIGKTYHVWRCGV